MAQEGQPDPEEGEASSTAGVPAGLDIFAKTGKYPDIIPQGHSIGVQALRYALTKLGDPYVWGAAGPSSFDCSGLVMWAYAQVGISLMHFTGDQWNEGEHISRSELQPGDLVFFYRTSVTWASTSATA